MAELHSHVIPYSRDKLRLCCGSRKALFRVSVSLRCEHPRGIYNKLEWIQTDGKVGVLDNHLQSPREHCHYSSCQTNVLTQSFICYNIMTY